MFCPSLLYLQAAAWRQVSPWMRGTYAQSRPTHRVRRLLDAQELHCSHSVMISRPEVARGLAAHQSGALP